MVEKKEEKGDRTSFYTYLDLKPGEAWVMFVYPKRANTWPFLAYNNIFKSLAVAVLSCFQKLR